MSCDAGALLRAAEKLNSVSSSFCLAKWMHATIHLHLGRTHSCHLPHHHVIAVNEIKKDVSSLHNTSYKKDLRKMMLKGERPKECTHCWQIEDLPGNNFSERHFYALRSWAVPFIDQISSMKWNKNIDPTYLELSFSSICNFKCMYCGPSYSTSWMREIESRGAYKLSDQNAHHCLERLRADDLVPLEQEDNIYKETFWKWWPSLKNSLMFLRITGGEPLLSEDTFKLLGLLRESPMPKLEFSINSNMGVPDKQFNKFIDEVKELVDENKIRHFNMHTSLDTYGTQAEYIRFGLDFGVFETRVIKYLEELPNSSLSVTCTFNVLSLDGFVPYLEWIISLRKKYSNEHRRINLDINCLHYPSFLSCAVLTKDKKNELEKIISFMESKKDERMGIFADEVIKMKRILEWLRANEPKTEHEHEQLKRNQIDFYLFISQYDLRRNADFLSVFPKMKDTYDYCKKLAQENV